MSFYWGVEMGILSTSSCPPLSHCSILSISPAPENPFHTQISNFVINLCIFLDIISHSHQVPLQTNPLLFHHRDKSQNVIGIENEENYYENMWDKIS